MSYCLNLDCAKPQNQGQENFCQTCGSKLLLKDRYRAIHPIGEGGFGRTLLAIDEHRLRTHCVIKQFRPHAKGTGTAKQTALAKAVQLFNQEAIRLSELGAHAQIPTLLAYFEQDSCLYLVQQLIEGKNLYQELQIEGAFSEQKIRDLLADLLPVLQFVHEHHVIHRDIKPGNILRCQSDDRLILIDFGIAKQLSGTELANVGTKIGTEGYAPVEQWRSGKVYPASDLYSLGATCIHLLTHVKPDSLFDPVMGRWRWQEHLAKQGISLSSQLEQILHKLLKDAVQERYQSADEVMRDLRLSPATINAGTQPILYRWRLLHTLKGHLDRIRSITISADGQTLISGSSDRTIRLWNVADGTPLATLIGHTEPIHAVVIHPNQQFLASGSGDKTIKLWHLGKAKLLHTFTEHGGWVNALAIDAKGQFLVSGSEDKTIKVWNLKTGKLVQTLTGHTGSIYAVAISPDGQILVSGGSDRTVRAWHLGSGKLLYSVTRHSNRINALAISANSQLFASGSDDSTIKIWDLKLGQLLHTLTNHTDSVVSVAISADSQILVSGSHDRTVKLWNLQTGEILDTFNGNTWWVNAVAISADGRTIGSGSADKIIQLWQADF